VYYQSVGFSYLKDNCQYVYIHLPSNSRMMFCVCHISVALARAVSVTLVRALIRGGDWAQNWIILWRYFADVIWLTDWRWCHKNDVITDFLKFNFITISLKNLNLVKSPNFRSPILKIKGRLAIFENLLLKQCIFGISQLKNLKQHFDSGGADHPWLRPWSFIYQSNTERFCLQTFVWLLGHHNG